MSEALTLIGFVILLASWFAMFARLRAHSKRAAGTLTDYVAAQPPFFGRSGMGLLPNYWRTFGFDVRLAGAVVGLILILAAVLTSR